MIYLFDGNGDWCATDKANDRHHQWNRSIRVASATTTTGRQRIQSYLADDLVSGDDQTTGAQAPTSSTLEGCSESDSF
jgi:hypothetical protein